MYSKAVGDLNKIYQLNEDIAESRARIAAIKYNARKGGLTSEKERSCHIENMRVRMNKLTLMRRNELVTSYSHMVLKEKVLKLPPLSRPSLEATIKSRSRSASLLSQSIESPRTLSSRSPSRRSEKVIDGRLEEADAIEEQNKWSTELVSPEEKAYYEKCKQYYYITQMPLISISDDIFYDHIELPSASLVCVIDEDPNEFDVKTFLNEISSKLNIRDIDITKIHRDCIKIVFDIFKEVTSTLKKIEIKALYKSITDTVRDQLGQLKVIYMFMGDIKALNEKQKFRNEITLHPEWDLIYGLNHTYWNGANQDGLDRGDQPYYCPVGWQRYSLNVTDQFHEKFKGWCVCYYGTNFSHGLSILLNGLAPAEMAQYGRGIYATPSIIYASHPRYSEIKEIESIDEKSFFKRGKYVQFVLQCRVHPKDIKKIDRETLETSIPTIDSEINNDVIQWLVDAKDKPIMDFNDPTSTLVCTGLMIRVTDTHPGLLPESQWWFKSHLCRDKGNQHCLLGIDFDDLMEQKLNGDMCNIIHE